MSFIRIVRNVLRALSPAFIAPRPSAARAEPLSARGGLAAEEPHPAGHAGCWLDRNLGSAHEGDTRGSFVEAGERFYAASRERTIVRALYDGSLRLH
jgi:hypothetical protein